MSADNRTREEVFWLPEGRAVLAWPDGMGPESFEDFRDWVALVLRKVERSASGGAGRPAAGGAGATVAVDPVEARVIALFESRPAGRGGAAAVEGGEGGGS